jgi:hypothetical protein
MNIKITEKYFGLYMMSRTMSVETSPHQEEMDIQRRMVDPGSPRQSQDIQTIQGKQFNGVVIPGSTPRLVNQAGIETDGSSSSIILISAQTFLIDIKLMQESEAKTDLNKVEKEKISFLPERKYPLSIKRSFFGKKGIDSKNVQTNESFG